jgi:hypothetical protein
MSVHDAELGDVYVDDQGKLWRVFMKCGEPTVHVQEIEPLCHDSPVTMAGGVSGQMWQGFKRIFRPQNNSEQ